jgi:hypothetical protein
MSRANLNPNACGISQMNCEPNGWRIGARPFDAMPRMSWNLHVVPRPKRSRRSFAFDAQTGRTRKHDHPFRPILIKPEIRRTGLARRDDPLDPRRRRVEQRKEFFAGALLGDVFEDVSRSHSSSPDFAASREVTDSPLCYLAARPAPSRRYRPEKELSFWRTATQFGATMAVQ